MQFSEGAGHSMFDVISVELLDEMGDNFRVRLGAEDVPFSDKTVLQSPGVLDHAVVDNRNPVVAVGVRVRVGAGHSAVRCPTSVADAGLRLAIGQDPAQVGNAPNAF